MLRVDRDSAIVYDSFPNRLLVNFSIDFKIIESPVLCGFLYLK